MLLTCLSPTAKGFLELAQALLPLGIECDPVADAFALSRRLDRVPTDATLIDVGWDAALEERLLSWLELRNRADSPIVVRTVVRDTRRVTRWLHAGAADVVAADVDVAELAARLMVATRRRAAGGTPMQLALGGFVLDRGTQCARADGRDLGLTPREFQLAWLLFSHPGSCVSRSTISLALWGADADITARTLEQHVHRLRKKMGLGAACGVHLHAAYGAGYRLTLDRRAPPASAALTMPPSARVAAGAAHAGAPGSIDRRAIHTA